MPCSFATHPLGLLLQALLLSTTLAPRARGDDAPPAFAFEEATVAELQARMQAGRLTARGLASGLWPVLPGGRPVPGGWLAALLLLAILVASRWIPRLFCRGFCPLGALLGVF